MSKASHARASAQPQGIYRVSGSYTKGAPKSSDPIGREKKIGPKEFTLGSGFQAMNKMKWHYVEEVRSISFLLVWECSIYVGYKVVLTNVSMACG